MDANRPHSADLSDAGGVDLLGLARRHWWLALLSTVLGVGGALQFTSQQTKVYESSTSVLVQPTGGGQDTNVAGGRTKGDINLDTEAQLVKSTAVAANAVGLLRSATPPEALAAGVSVAVPANTSVLVITFDASSARDAQAGSHAFAESYLRNRQDSAKADIADQIATINDKLNQLNTSLGQVNQRLAGLKGGDPNRANLETQRSTMVNQVNSLAGRLNELATTTVSAGQIIRDADLPGAPSRPNKLLNLASGAMIGLLLGVAAGLVRERLDKRVRRAADLPRRADVPVIASIPARMRPRLDDVFAPFGTGGRTFNRLRNEVLASMPPPLTGDARAALAGQVVVVAGASRGAASTVVAANLAAAFARTGAETVFVSAHLPDSLVDLASVDRMLGVRAVPGLSDMLAGRVPLRAVVQRAPRHPSLNVITTGGTASAAGLLQSQALRDTLAALRERAAYVVVEAPSTATSADAQSLASLADAAIIAVELRRTRYSDVEDAADQLRRVGTPLLGAVVLPRLAAGEGRGEDAPRDEEVDGVIVSDLWDDAPALSRPDEAAPRGSHADNDVTAFIPVVPALPPAPLVSRLGGPRDAVSAVNPISSSTPLSPLSPPSPTGPLGPLSPAGPLNPPGAGRRARSRGLDEHLVKRVGGGAELDALEQEVAGLEQRLSVPHPAEANGKSPEKRR